MAKKPKKAESESFASSFSNIELLRDMASYREYAATERLTGRAVRLMLIVSDIIAAKSESSVQEFLALTSRISSLPFATPLLRAEMLPDSQLLLVYEIQGESPLAFFGDSLNREFAFSSAVVIKIATLLLRTHQLGFIHGEISDDSLVMDEAREPSVRGFGFQAFTSLTGDSGRFPSDSTPPELLTGGSLSTSTDIYGLGAIMYLAATGHRWTDGFPNLIDAILSHDPPPVSGSDYPSRAITLMRGLLEKDPSKRTSDLAAFIRDLNEVRMDAGLPQIVTGLSEVDDVEARATPLSDKTWSAPTETSDGVLHLNADRDATVGETVDVRDGDDRALSVRAVASGRRPKVISVHRTKTSTSGELDREAKDLESRTRDKPTIEEWRPETMSDAWTVPVENIAAIVICRNGHRVSMGSLFCNFCGVTLDDPTTDLPAAPSPEPPRDIVDTPSVTCRFGHSAPAGAGVCPTCGVPILAVTSPTVMVEVPPTHVGTPTAVDTPLVEASRSCPRGHVNHLSAAFCGECGLSITIESPVEVASEPIVDTPLAVVTDAPFGPTATPSVVGEPEMAELDVAVCPAGHPNAASATFCRECGAPVAHEAVTDTAPAEDDEDVTPDLVFCSNDHPNRAFARFCRWCAEPLSSSSSIPSAPSTPTPVEAVRPIEPAGLPGRPFLSSASPTASSDGEVIFDQAHVVPIREEADVIRALSKQKEVRAVRRTVVEGLSHAPKSSSETTTESEPTET